MEIYTEKVRDIVSKEEASYKGPFYQQVETEPSDEVVYDAVPNEDPTSESVALEEASADVYNKPTYDTVLNEEPTSESAALEEVSIDAYEVIDNKVANEELANYSKYAPPLELTCELNVERNNSVYIF